MVLTEFQPIYLKDLQISIPGISIIRLAHQRHSRKSDRVTNHHHKHSQILLYLRGHGFQKINSKQFEVHRSVNPNDVENAAWHFLCLARADSFEKASSLVLPAPNDPRIPMEEVLKMLKSGDTSLVKNRINTVPESSGERARAEFYGFFYLGLFADAKGNQQEALQWLRKSAEDAPHHYMGDVARVYVQYLISELDGNK